MPDGEIVRLMQTILRAAEMQFEALASERGLTLPGEMTAPPVNLFEGWGHEGAVADQFSTGYDSGSGTTTMAFTPDMSILTDGSSGDILTGS